MRDLPLALAFLSPSFDILVFQPLMDGLLHCYRAFSAPIKVLRSALISDEQASVLPKANGHPKRSQTLFSLL
jgi:hypothetical protein